MSLVDEQALAITDGSDSQNLPVSNLPEEAIQTYVADITNCTFDQAKNLVFCDTADLTGSRLQINEVPGAGNKIYFYLKTDPTALTQLSMSNVLRQTPFRNQKGPTNNIYWPDTGPNGSGGWRGTVGADIDIGTDGIPDFSQYVDPIPQKTGFPHDLNGLVKMQTSRPTEFLDTNGQLRQSVYFLYADTKLSGTFPILGANMIYYQDGTLTVVILANLKSKMGKVGAKGPKVPDLAFNAPYVDWRGMQPPDSITPPKPPNNPTLPTGYQVYPSLGMDFNNNGGTSALVARQWCDFTQTIPPT